MITAPLFVQASASGELASRLRMEEEKMGTMLGWKFKVVERGGRMIRDLLTKSIIFAGEVCGRKDC